MKILITGSGGFIGKNLTEAWRDKFDLLTPRSFELDLLDISAVKKYLQMNDVDVIVHAAKNDAVYCKSASDYEVLDKNLRMFFNLASCSDCYEKLIYFGSGAEYDKRTSISLAKEEDIGQFIPSDPYGFSKYIMSQFTARTKKIYELCLFGVYGKYEDYNRRFISSNLCSVIRGESMSLRQNARFDYLYIDDLCCILEWFLYAQPMHSTYNVCSGTPVELMDLAEMIGEVTGTKSLPVAAKDGYQPDYTGDNSRLIKEMGGFQFTPHITSIEKLYAYYLSIQDEIKR